MVKRSCERIESCIKKLKAPTDVTTVYGGPGEKSREVKEPRGPSPVEQALYDSYLDIWKAELQSHWEPGAWDSETALSFEFGVGGEGYENLEKVFIARAKKSLDQIFARIIQANPTTEAQKIFLFKEIKEQLEEQGYNMFGTGWAQEFADYARNEKGLEVTGGEREHTGFEPTRMSDIVIDTMYVPAFVEAGNRILTRLRRCGC